MFIRPDRERGVRALQPFKSGSFACEFEGNLLSTEECKRAEKEYEAEGKPVYILEVLTFILFEWNKFNPLCNLNFNYDCHYFYRPMESTSTPHCVQTLSASTLIMRQEGRTLLCFRQLMQEGEHVLDLLPSPTSLQGRSCSSIMDTGMYIFI